MVPLRKSDSTMPTGWRSGRPECLGCARLPHEGEHPLADGADFMHGERVVLEVLPEDRVQPAGAVVAPGTCGPPTSVDLRPKQSPARGTQATPRSHPHGGPRRTP